MRTVTMIILVLVLFVAVSCMAQPTGAQGFTTPTPLPSVKATIDAANAIQQAGQSSIQQADQMDAQAAELRRNGMVQQQQAAQAISDARAATASQNALAIGEAMGRADSNLSELSKTNAAQADMIATLTVNQKAQASTIISASNELSQLRAENQRLSTDKQTILQNFDALQTRLNDQQTSSTISPTVAVIAGLTGIFGLIGFVAWKWSRPRRDAPRSNDAPPPASTPHPARGEEETPIDGDFTVRDDDREDNTP